MWVEWVIKECSACAGLIEHERCTGGFSWEQIAWSDGKVEGEMVADAIWLVGCPRCEALVWIEELKERRRPSLFTGDDDVDLFSRLDLLRRLERAPELRLKCARGLGVSDYLRKLEEGSLPRDKELYLRTELWWHANNGRRGRVDPPEFSAPDRENLDRLYQLLNPRDAYERLMMTEINRELGRFDAAGSLLRAPFIKDYQEVAREYRALIAALDRAVVALTSGLQLAL